NIPAGTLWASSVSRLVYEQVTLAVISGGSASVEIECLTPGAAGNLSTSSALSLPSPLPGVLSAVVASTVVSGEDEEDLDTYRSRLLQRMREQPQGGAAGDYIRWALEVTGVVKAFATRNSGGDVLVYPLVAVSGSARVPAAGKLAEIQAYLQDPARRPLAANVYALSSTERTVDITISGLSPADAATKANILAAITAYLYAAYPRQYLDDPAPTHIISLAAIWGIIIAQGAVATGVAMAVSGIGSGVSTYEIPMGEIVKLGALAWA
ncbi:MAG: baseplate J/gp47 family protein, partial [Spirochaetaceae bacterium]|nr:baseplate J/gp47 family protein [Spirochaetaceae bacterium]